MEVRFNVTGNRRKELVKKISEALGGWEIKYLGAPTFAYRVGDFEIDRNGTLIFADRTDTKLVERVLEALAQAGFECEEQTANAELAAETIEEKPEQTTAYEPISLSFSLPMKSWQALDISGVTSPCSQLNVTRSSVRV